MNDDLKWNFWISFGEKSCIEGRLAQNFIELNWLLRICRTSLVCNLAFKRCRTLAGNGSQGRLRPVGLRVATKLKFKTLLAIRKKYFHLDHLWKLTNILDSHTIPRCVRSAVDF